LQEIKKIMEKGEKKLQAKMLLCITVVLEYIYFKPFYDTCKK